MAKEVVVTREGYNKLEQELENLRTVKRKEVADKIKVARGYGDLSENAEYDAAKEEQASVEARIADLEATLKLARIMDESELSNDTASIGMHVKILAEGDDLEDAEEYDLTGSTEADMDLNRISDESPVGAARSVARSATALMSPCPTATSSRTSCWKSAARSNNPQ